MMESISHASTNQEECRGSGVFGKEKVTKAMVGMQEREEGESAVVLSWAWHILAGVGREMEKEVGVWPVLS